MNIEVKKCAKCNGSGKWEPKTPNRFYQAGDCFDCRGTGEMAYYENGIVYFLGKEYKEGDAMLFTNTRSNTDKCQILDFYDTRKETFGKPLTVGYYNIKDIWYHLINTRTGGKTNTALYLSIKLANETTQLPQEKSTTDKIIVMGAGNFDMPSLAQVVARQARDDEKISIIMVDDSSDIVSQLNKKKVVVDEWAKNENIFIKYYRGRSIMGFPLGFKCMAQYLEEYDISSYLKLKSEYELVEKKESKLPRSIRDCVRKVYEQLYKK
jgi:hypothetical protein